MIPILGLDIGQKREFTAIAVVEFGYRPTDAARLHRRHKESHFVVRHLERLEPGSGFPVVARRLGEICRAVTARGNRRPIVYADATGLGAPVIGLLRAEAPDARRIWAVHFNHGDRRVEDRDRYVVTLGKAFAVSRLQTLLQGDRLHLSRTPEADVLATELLDYEIRVSEDANERYGAFRVGTHDDLVTALGLACQREPSISVYPSGATAAPVQPAPGRHAQWEHRSSP